MSSGNEKTEEKQKRRGAVLIYETLREDILWLKIAPGTAIDEVALSRRFAVSRTPIREALLLLQGDWLVQFLPNRTSIVAPLSLNNSGQYFDSHLVLGRTTARAAAASGKAERAGLEPHLGRFRSAVEKQDFNDALRASLALMRDLTQLTGNIFLDRYFGHSLDSGIRTKVMFYFPQASQDELLQAGDHMAHLIDAVVSGDPEGSDKAMSELMLAEIKIILRALHPSIGDRMDIRGLEEMT